LSGQELLEGDIYDPDVTPHALPTNLELNVSTSALSTKSKKTQMEGLLGGDSDSSELTQPDDDEESTYSARRSVMTNKDDDDDDELNIPAGPTPSAYIYVVNVLLFTEAKLAI
jgi:hypothetical protein